MAKYLSGRRTKMRERLSGTLIHKVMTTLFPRKNDYGNGSFDELVPELEKFGIITRKDLKSLMTRHRKRLLRLDRSPLPASEVPYCRQLYGAKFVNDSIRRQYWFAYPALVRTAMELEFGEAAVIYENEVPSVSGAEA